MITAFPSGFANPMHDLVFIHNVRQNWQNIRSPGGFCARIMSGHAGFAHGVLIPPNYFQIQFDGIMIFFLCGGDRTMDLFLLCFVGFSEGILPHLNSQSSRSSTSIRIPSYRHLIIEHIYIAALV